MRAIRLAEETPSFVIATVALTTLLARERSQGSRIEGTGEESRNPADSEYSV